MQLFSDSFNKLEDRNLKSLCFQTKKIYNFQKFSKQICQILKKYTFPQYIFTTDVGQRCNGQRMDMPGVVAWMNRETEKAV
jgi:hypothetical protein